MAATVEFITSSTSSQSCTTWSMAFPNLVEPRETPTMDEAKARIDELYESGVPFFSKSAIREIWDQFKAQPAAGDKIIFKDLTGTTLECEVKLGKSQMMRSGDQKMEHVYKELGISYNCAAQLKKNIDYEFDEQVLDAVYSPLGLTHRLNHVDSSTETKEIVPDDDVGEREVVAQDFQEKKQAWEESETCKNFRSILSSFASGHEINKIVGLACGSLSLPNNKHAAYQHALLVTARDWLKEQDQTKEVACYIQDPMNTAVDREILADVGFEVIDDPRGWLEVDEQSVVLSISPNVPVKEIIADIARPAVVIWDRVESEDKANSTDPDSPRVRKMMEGYDLHELGPDGEPFSDAVIYIRKSAVAPALN